MTSIYNYLLHDTIPEDDVEADRIARKVKSYTLIERTLYKRGSHGVLMRCISQTDGIKLLTEIHEGVMRTSLATLFHIVLSIQQVLQNNMSLLKELKNKRSFWVKLVQRSLTNR